MGKTEQAPAGNGCLALIVISGVLTVGLIALGKVSKPRASASNHESTMSVARPACTDAIKSQARYAARFTTWGAMSATHARADGDNTVFLGDDLEMQNGFGVWRKASYRCTFNRVTGKATAIVVER
jgi:hypothetical protein